MVITAVLAVVSYYIIRWLFTEMAKRNILFTLRTEGEIKAIMRGDKCVRYVMTVENHIIDPIDFDIFKGSFRAYANQLAKIHEVKKAEDPGFVERKLVEIKGPDGGKSLKKNDDGSYKFNEDFEDKLIQTNPQEKENFSLLERWFGIVWVGFPPYRVFTYNFRWIKYAQEKDSNETKPTMKARQDLVSSLYFRYPVYGVIIDDAETGAGSFGKTEDGSQPKLERIQLKLELTLETETINPQKTLFRTAGLSSAGDWLSAISKEARDAIRTWVGSLDYDTFVASGSNGADSKITTGLGEIRDRINNAIIENGVAKDRQNKAQISAVLDYGQRIVKISLINMDFADSSLQNSMKDIFKAKQDVLKADQERQAMETRAKGERAKAAAPILGKADGLRQIAGIQDGGREMYIAEQLGQLKGVYAPGQDKVFLNVATGVTGSNPPAPEKKDEPKKGDV